MKALSVVLVTAAIIFANDCFCSPVPSGINTGRRNPRRNSNSHVLDQVDTPRPPRVNRATVFTGFADPSRRFRADTILDRSELYAPRLDEYGNLDGENSFDEPNLPRPWTHRQDRILDYRVLPYLSDEQTTNLYGGQHGHALSEYHANDYLERGDIRVGQQQAHDRMNSSARQEFIQLHYPQLREESTRTQDQIDRIQASFIQTSDRRQDQRGRTHPEIVAMQQEMERLLIRRLGPQQFEEIRQSGREQRRQRASTQNMDSNRARGSSRQRRGQSQQQGPR
jgi:hypothetical protein